MKITVRTSFVLAAAVAALIPLAGCSSGSAAADNSSQSAGASAGSGDGSASSAETNVDTKPVVELQKDGLGFFVGGASSVPMLFGKARVDAVKTELTKVLGPLDTNELGECGQGPRTGVSGDGFSTLFDGTKLVGWTEQGGSARHLVTADGIGIGSSLVDLKAALGKVEITSGSLGTEWVAGPFTGLLDGTVGTSKVTVISAGETCFAR